MNRPVLLLISLGTLGATACAPQNADLESGSMVAFLSRNTSAVFFGSDINYENFENSWDVDCRALPASERLETGGGVECFETEGEDPQGQGVAVGERGMRHETWVDRDAFLVVQEPLDDWRGEAVITSENDLQLTFHHRLPGGDFRFATVIDPNFQPVQCRPDESGELALQPIDGDWIANWTRAMSEPNFDGGEVAWPDNRGSDGFIVPLNAVSYQFNPDQTEQTWSLPPTMEAGHTQARFGPEDMRGVGSRYGLPAAYLQFDLDDRRGPPPNQIWYTALPEGLDETQVKQSPQFKAMMQSAESTALETVEELRSLGVDAPESFQPFVPSNAWRTPDGTTGGFDGWAEMHYSWVRIDQSRDAIEPGAELTGEFAAWYFGDNSQSRVLVHGTFTVSRVKRDRWTTPDVQTEKLEENNTNLCGVQFGEE